MQKRKKVYVNIKIEDEIASAFKEAAAAEGISQTAFIQRLLEIHQIRNMVESQDPLSMSFAKLIREMEVVLKAKERQYQTAHTVKI